MALAYTYNGLNTQWPTLEVSTEPATEPVDLCELKDFIQYDDDDQDSVLMSLAKAARIELERVTKRAFVTQTLKLYLDDFPAWEIQLRKPPVASITSVVYTDQDGTSQTVSSANYQSDLKSYPARLWPAYGKVWPTDVKEDTMNAVVVTFVSGVAQASVDERIKTAIKVATKMSFDGCDNSMAYDALVNSLCWDRTWA